MICLSLCSILKSLDAPRKVKVPAGLIAKKKSLKAMREESRKQRKHERRMKARSTTEEDDNELDSFDKNILPHLTRYQKACLRWVMDEERGTLATKAPVLYANMSFNDLKDKYPGMPVSAKLESSINVSFVSKVLTMFSHLFCRLDGQSKGSEQSLEEATND